MSLLPIDEALHRLLADLKPLGCEEVATARLPGRILAEDLKANLDHPSADNSAMDGFALTAAAGTVRRQLVAVAAAGHPSDSTLQFEEAARIFTGGLLPPGADAVLIQEDAHWDEHYLQPKLAPELGAHIRRRGEDFRQGDLLMGKGSTIQAMDLALIAAQGFETLQVHRRPRVAVVATGDELVAPGKSLGPGQIYESNSLMVGAQSQAAGAELGSAEHLLDDPVATEAAITRLSAKHDLLIFCGGASVGDHDHVVSSVAALSDDDLVFYKVRMKPGKPVAAARIGNCTVLCLPGNPASSAVAFEQFVRPCIRQLQGDLRPHRRLERRLLDGAIDGHGRRCIFLRARLNEPGRVLPLAHQGSGMLSSLSGVDGLIMLPPGQGPLEPGDPVAVQILSGTGSSQPPEAQWAQLQR